MCRNRTQTSSIPPTTITKAPHMCLLEQFDMMIIIIIILRTKILFQPVVEIGLLFGGILKLGGHKEVTMAQFKSLPN